MDSSAVSIGGGLRAVMGMKRLAKSKSMVNFNRGGGALGVPSDQEQQQQANQHSTGAKTALLGALNVIRKRDEQVVFDDEASGDDSSSVLGTSLASSLAPGQKRDNSVSEISSLDPSFIDFKNLGDSMDKRLLGDGLEGGTGMDRGLLGVAGPMALPTEVGFADRASVSKVTKTPSSIMAAAMNVLNR